MRLLGALIFSVLGLMLATYISVDWSNSAKDISEPELVTWDYKLTEVKQFTGYNARLYQGKSGECYLKVAGGTAMGLTVVNCNDFMDETDGK